MRHEQPSTASSRVLELERMSLDELERVFLDGTTPRLDDLAGWEFRGLNSPSYFKLLGIKKFIKGFYRSGEQVYGYNRPVAQNAIKAPWIPKDKRFGFYLVEPVQAAARDNHYLHALLLDYGRGDNPRTDPSRGLRDYLIQVDRNNRDLFLGKAYYALGPARLPTRSFFILERFRVTPP